MLAEIVDGDRENVSLNWPQVGVDGDKMFHQIGPGSVLTVAEKMFYQIGPRSASCSINMSELRPSFFVEC
jgi:hypothetical protein